MLFLYIYGVMKMLTEEHIFFRMATQYCGTYNYMPIKVCKIVSVEVQSPVGLTWLEVQSPVGLTWLDMHI